MQLMKQVSKLEVENEEDEKNWAAAAAGHLILIKNCN